jgi:hypothetical protein
LNPNLIQIENIKQKIENRKEERKKPYQTLPGRGSPTTAQQAPTQHSPVWPKIPLRSKKPGGVILILSCARGGQHDGVLNFPSSLSIPPRPKP